MHPYPTGDEFESRQPPDDDARPHTQAGVVLSVEGPH